MKRAQMLSLGLLFFVQFPSLQAQFIPIPVPNRVGGIGFSYDRPNFHIRGFVGGVRTYGGFVPPGLVPVVPFGTYGVVQQRVEIQILAPPVIVVRPEAFVQPRPEYDVSGVDLDVVRLPSAAELAAGKPLRAEPIKPPPPRIEKPAKKVVVPPEKKIPPKKLPPPKKEIPPIKRPVPPKLTPKQQQENLIRLGLDAFTKKLYGLAALRFRQAALAEPIGHRPHFLLAQASFALGKYDQAVVSIHAGMDRQPRWPTAMFRPRLELYKGMEPQLDTQLKRLQKAVAQKPKRSDFLFLLAYQYWFDGRQAEAAGLFRRARQTAKNPLYIDQFLRAAKGGQIAAK